MSITKHYDILNNMKKKVTYSNSVYEVESYTKVKTFFTKIGILQKDKKRNYDDNPIIGALINNLTVPLGERIEINCEIKPIHLFSDIGLRMYRHSICFLLCYAVHLVYPKHHLTIGHSLGDGFYFSFYHPKIDTEEAVTKIRKKMNELCANNLSIHPYKLSYEDSMAYFKSENFNEASMLLKYKNQPTVQLYQIENYMDTAYEPLVDNTEVLSLWELRPYNDNGLLLRYPRSENLKEIGPFKDNPLLYSVFKEYKHWSEILKVQSLGNLSMVCKSNGLKDYILMEEALLTKKISSIADDINKRHLQLVLVSGPSSSGKTTFAKKLCLSLRLLGFNSHRISLDDYYFTRDKIPKDEEGEYDYEALEALDLDLFRNQIKALYKGNSIKLPQFDFQINKRNWKEEPLKMDSKTILVIEGIHGLNPKLLPDFDRNKVYKIYISALSQLNIDDHNRISTTDNRLIRRIVRDNRTRNVDPLTSLLMWPSVTRGEKIHIFPYQNEANVMLNSALDYEFGVLAPLVQPLLKMVKPNDGYAYTQSRRLLSFLDNVHPIQSKMVPEDSLLREFIGYK